ncbi:MAG: RNA polymerase sigma factor [Flavobacteriaceae bacterium]|nr:RNA polymerase sigma factor [Flavobacteriaceae bacterium]
MAHKYFIEKLQEGDEEAFKELVEKYSDALFGYALSLSGNHHTANDLIQEVFISTFEFRKKLNHKYSIESFLYKSTYNKFIDLYYKNKSRSKLHEQYYLILNQLLIKSEDNSLILIKMSREIENLPKKIKEIFVLSKTNGYTNLEISKTLNISIKTVESNITKGYKILRKKLEN